MQLKSWLIIRASLQSHVEVYQFPIQSMFASYFLCLSKSTWSTLSNYSVIRLNNSSMLYSHFLLILCLLECSSFKPRAAFQNIAVGVPQSEVRLSEWHWQRCDLTPALFCRLIHFSTYSAQIAPSSWTSQRHKTPLSFSVCIFWRILLGKFSLQVFCLT